ncbi:MAG TPA: oxygenase MpaB family protein [Jatrophihabitantaceae bacterium]|jgi:uncharacterized protein (DUF2236 family)
MTDFGYFGPGSVTWRVHAEPLTMVGGLRALLLQALHPEAMRLLYERSSFQDDPWARLQRTVIYVATVSFGTTAEVDAAAAHVREVHRLLGVTDREQLAWVHACEVSSFLIAARYAGVRLSADDADAYIAEQVRAARLVGVPARLAPRTVADINGYFDAMRPRLRLTPEAQEAARVVIAPPLPVPRRWTLPARAGWNTLVTLAIGLLPEWARRLYRLPSLPGTGITTHAGMRAARVAVATLPETWRHGPHYRRAMARAQPSTPASSASSPSHGSTSGDAA